MSFRAVSDGVLSWVLPPRTNPTILNARAIGGQSYRNGRVLVIHTVPFWNMLLHQSFHKCVALPLKSRWEPWSVFKLTVGGLTIRLLHIITTLDTYTLNDMHWKHITSPNGATEVIAKGGWTILWDQDALKSGEWMVRKDDGWCLPNWFCSKKPPLFVLNACIFHTKTIRFMFGRS